MHGGPQHSPEALDRGLRPKLLDHLASGYGASALKSDALAGLTVAIVALPLSMAIAIASGLPPERGLYTAIVGGFIISLLGGSRYQIGGPAGAFIVLIFAIVQTHGYDGLVIATCMAGVMMMLIGVLRLGSLILLMPHAVIVGFTSGIAVIIFASQIKELLGLTLPSEPAALLPKLMALSGALPTLNLRAVLLSLACIALILLLRRWRPTWPGFLMAAVLAAAGVALTGLEVATVGSRFGAMPSALPSPHLPEITGDRLIRLLPSALAIALLGSIESLLSAVVADRLSGDRQRPNAELVAQGTANILTAICGGFCVTGTIARTATNIKAGAAGPVSGMLHALYLLGFLMLAAPLAAYVPMAALGAILAIVCWNMADRDEFMRLLHQSWSSASTVLVTFLGTIAVNLLVGLALGVLLAGVLHLWGKRVSPLP